MKTSLALNAKTQFAQINKDQTLAYRVFGSGSPIIFANRFRGSLDSWDPEFLDTVAETNQVIIFQYAGTGSSSGRQSMTNLEIAQEIIGLADYLKINRFAVAGWSLGGFNAQVAMTEFQDRITHGILIGTRIPGKESSPIQNVFFQHALKPSNDLQDEEVLFFNPAYPESKVAAEQSHNRIAQRTEDKALPMRESEWKNLLQVTGFREDQYGTFEKMKNLKIPVLAIVGENDICFAAEDWFKLKGQLGSTQILLMPKSGHGPQQQYPKLSGKYIADFVSSN